MILGPLIIMQTLYAKPNGQSDDSFLVCFLFYFFL